MGSPSMRCWPHCSSALAFHQWQMNRPDWLYAFGIGLFIGIPIGINIFCRTLQDIEVLSNALRNVDEA